MLYLLAQVSPSATAAPSQGTGGSLLIFLPLILAFYFLGIRPKQKMLRAQQALMREIAVGDEIETAAGFYGTVRDADELTLDVELAPGMVVKMSRAAVRRKVLQAPDDAPGGLGGPA